MKFTHTGTLIGDARSPKPITVKLRETKNFWVRENGAKYRKSDGWPAGDEAWPLYSLDIDSIKPLV